MRKYAQIDEKTRNMSTRMIAILIIRLLWIRIKEDMGKERHNDAQHAPEGHN